MFIFVLTGIFRSHYDWLRFNWVLDFLFIIPASLDLDKIANFVNNVDFGDQLKLFMLQVESL